MVLTALVFFIILSILVLIHELGHFAVARLIGVKVEEFGIGLPPRIIGEKWKGILWSVNWLPIGGFVKLAGEDDEDSAKVKVQSVKLHEYFFHRSKKERAGILLAGVTMNFVLAVGITTFLLTQGVQEPSGRIHIERVVAGSPAEKAGLQVGDIIESIFVYPKVTEVIEPKITTTSQVIEFVKKNSGVEIGISVLRNGQSMMIRIIPRKEYPKGEGPTGIAISDLEPRVYSWSEAPIKALIINLTRAKEMLLGIITMAGRLVRFEPIGADVAGPIGIAQVTGEAVKFGWKAVLEFMSILSLNLAVLNILPIPALDGGRLAFVFLEKALGKKLRPAFERSAHQIGMIVLLFLVLLVSIHDILRITRGG